MVSFTAISSSCSFCASWVWNSLINCFKVELCFNSRSSCSCLDNKRHEGNYGRTKASCKEFTGLHSNAHRMGRGRLRVCECVCVSRYSKLWLPLGNGPGDLKFFLFHLSFFGYIPNIVILHVIRALCPSKWTWRNTPSLCLKFLFLLSI